MLFAQVNVLQHSLLHAMNPDPHTSLQVVVEDDTLGDWDLKRASHTSHGLTGIRFYADHQRCDSDLHDCSGNFRSHRGGISAHKRFRRDVFKHDATC